MANSTQRFWDAVSDRPAFLKGLAEDGYTDYVALPQGGRSDFVLAWNDEHGILMYYHDDEYTGNKFWLERHSLSQIAQAILYDDAQQKHR